MTTARSSFSALLNLADDLNCSGVEVRNDLATEIFDGLDGTAAADLAKEHGVRLLALAEVPAFNDKTHRAIQAASDLAEMAAGCEAEGIVLIPRNDGIESHDKTSRDERQQTLHWTLSRLIPVLETFDIKGFIEPLGFSSSSIRSKNEVADVINSLNAKDRFAIIHDTFHHALALEEELFPDHTAIVHFSGVRQAELTVSEMKDEHRELVDQDDVLNNTEQISQLRAAGYKGPFSCEAFSPAVHGLDNPRAALSECFQYIESSTTAASA